MLVKANTDLRLVVVGPEWALHFERERSRIASALADSAIDIQHIGSTAVPGIAAKPVLDIAIAIRDFESGHEFLPDLVALGYAYRGENGIPRRHYLEHPDLIHLHLFEQQSPDWKRHIRFRERLLSSPELAARYSQVKQDALAESGGCRERYQTLKAPFIQRYQAP